MQPIVAIAADIRAFQNYRWHAAPEPYLEAAFGVAGVLPLIVPALGERIDAAALVGRVDGVMLTGSRTNVHPRRYGGEATPAHEPYDEDRDATALALIRATVDAGVPLFAICRGMQELNVAYGGSLATEIQERDGTDDHRAPESDVQDERFRIAHGIDLEPGGRMAEIAGSGRIDVNSLHRQAIDRLADTLVVEARADDGTIEAVSVAGAKGFAVGVQWHPEYWAKSDAPSAALFRAFGQAVREFAQARAGAA
ncbi:gamma-glutamyl-gamma-aminobutyrate hydrolase family protein [Oricola sp.]|uniref:gamma-glutamyl-gamma-aminobutyrate hydrolase family protein n=1 Tax=Oricola sp. TaxID=1979950 RepID=UPI003BACF56F